MGENTKLIDALTKLGLQNGKGSDGNKRSIGSRLSQLRSAMFRKERQASNAEGKGCMDLEKELKEFNTSASNGVKGVGKDINNAEITKATKKLKEINSRTTLEADLKSCAKEKTTKQTATLLIINIRVYVFWMNWFKIYVVIVKITVLEASFGIPSSPSPAQSPSPPGLTTKGPTKATQANAVAPTSSNKCAKKTLASNCKINCECFTLKCTVSTGTSSSSIDYNTCNIGESNSFNDLPFTGKHGSDLFSLTAAESEKYGPCDIKCAKSGGSASFDGKISCAKKGNTYEWMSEAITKACPSGSSAPAPAPVPAPAPTPAPVPAPSTAPANAPTPTTTSGFTPIFTCPKGTTTSSQITNGEAKLTCKNSQGQVVQEKTVTCSQVSSVDLNFYCCPKCPAQPTQPACFPFC